MRPRVLLINPPVDTFSHKLSRGSFPLGLCYLGTFIKEAGYQVKIIDAQIEGNSRTKLQRPGMVRLGLTLEEIEERIFDFNPDLLGISCNFHTNFKPAMDIAEIAKTKCRIKYVVAGGSYASVVPERIMKSVFIDYLVIGEAEETFKQLLEKLFSGSAIGLEQMDGFAYRLKDSSLRINKKAHFIPAEEFKAPDRDLLPVEEYIRLNRPHSILTKGKRVLEVLTSRGCNASCTFCSATLLQGKFRGRDPEGVIGELKLLKEKYATDEVQFIDDNLTMDRKRAEAIFKLMVSEKLNLHWCAPNGIAISTLDDELIRLMKQSGCYMVSLAIESGSQKVITRLMKKPLLLEEIYPVVKTFKKLNISLEAFLVIGMPGETFEDIKKTFDFVFRLGIFKAHFNYAMPIPSTPLYEEYKLLKGKNTDKSGNSTDDEEYYFDYRMPVISTREWTSFELRRFVTGKVINFYLKYMFFRPHIFINEIRKVICDPKTFCEIVKYYLTYILKRNSSRCC